MIENCELYPKHKNEVCKDVEVWDNCVGIFASGDVQDVARLYQVIRRCGTVAGYFCWYSQIGGDNNHEGYEDHYKY